MLGAGQRGRRYGVAVVGGGGRWGEGRGRQGAGGSRRGRERGQETGQWGRGRGARYAGGQGAGEGVVEEREWGRAEVISSNRNN